MLVAFDTVFDQCSIAILLDGHIIYEKTVLGGRGQTEIILPMLDEALYDTKIDMAKIKAWAFNRGPGGFSGIRINTAVVQALSVANDAVCVGVSSLQALAFVAQQTHNLTKDTTITAVMDARQQEVYVGEFIAQPNQAPMPKSSSHEYLLSYGTKIDADVVVGDGVPLVETQAMVCHQSPNACHIGQLAYPVFLNNQGVKAELALPVYLRNNAWKTLDQQGKEQAKI